ncbi:DUF3152 domain-containing protein [Candidatus Saccharibacteria bacterium]|nr:DUF3152 domain-containing protein [Candidatus Saccharibacteria bacterium]
MTNLRGEFGFVAIIVVIFTTFLGLGNFFVQKANANELSSAKSQLEQAVKDDRIEILIPEDFERWPEKVADSGVGSGGNPNGTNTASTGDAKGHMVDGVKVIYYKTMVWGKVEANFEDFRAKVKETLNDSRGWVRAGLKFVEVSSGQDVNVVLSDPANLDATGGCSGDLSCTTWNNEVIINDERWRGGTTASRAAGMGTRDYQHMVINHEMGHWLGHYAHIEGCENGGPAPIMLQQSTGMRGCSTFNAWPLDFELWTLR